MKIADYLLANTKSWAEPAKVAELDAKSIRHVDMDEMQLMELAEAHIAMRTDLAFDCAAQFKQRLDEIKHTRWFNLLIRQTLVKKYNLAGMGI